MPFTLAHPAAVIPLPRLLGRVAVPSALVIGSIVPDCSYFLALDIPRRQTHSVAGLLWFCLPLGLIGYVLFHTVVKLPLLSLLPPILSRRLSRVSAVRPLPDVPWAAVLISLLVGAMTHLVWDTFTHPRDFGVVTLPWLSTTLFSIGEYKVRIFKILQHLGTVLGMAALPVWVARWVRRTPEGPAPEVSFGTTARTIVIAMILVAVTVVAILNARPYLLPPVHVAAAVGEATITGISTLLLATVLYSVLWHAYVRWTG